MQKGTEIRLTESLQQHPAHEPIPAGVRGVIVDVYDRENKPFEAVLDLLPAKIAWPPMVIKMAADDGRTLPPYRVAVLLRLNADQFVAEEAQGFEAYFYEHVQKLTGMINAARTQGFAGGDDGG
jgi:hypothetical protein